MFFSLCFNASEYLEESPLHILVASVNMLNFLNFMIKTLSVFMHVPEKGNVSETHVLKKAVIFSL